MKLKTLPLLALLALPAAAQERWQIGLGANFQDSTRFTGAIGNQEYAVKRRATWAPALQLGYRAWDFGKHDVTFTGEYQFSTKYRVVTSPGGEDDSYKMQFWAPGLQWNYHFSRDFHCGLGTQLRFADLKDRETGVKATHTRPWADVHATYTFPTSGPVRPYAGLRLSRALATVEPQPDTAMLLNDPRGAARSAMRRLDGRWEMSVQAGVRF
jgi:hypothetical protein